MDTADVLNNVERLKRQNSDLLADRLRIKHVMNGGADAVYATMVWDQGKGASMRRNRNLSDLGEDLPAVNLIASGLERLSQQVGVEPTLSMPYGPRDSSRARRRAEKRERIVEGWDHASRMKMHYPQIGRWLPGYSFSAWTITDRTQMGQTYPHARLRDPYDVYLGWAGPDQDPAELAIMRKVPFEALRRTYDRDDWDVIERKAKDRYASSSMGTADSRGWEGRKTGLEVAEYWCSQGTYLCVPELELVLDFIPNPLESGPAFVVAQKFSFDRPISQYHHVFGLMAMMAKLNILGLIASEDSVFRETNIYGELLGEEYERGRFAVNLFEPGTKVERLTGDQAQQLWAQIDRIERQVRIGAQYDVQQDGQSPNSFATGMGMRELQTAAANNVREYQTVIADAIERLDAKRLEWDEKLHTRATKRVYVLDGGREVVENYTPARDIDGNYRSRRKYGMMATWDESTKIVGGLQLLQAEIIDPLTFQENLHGVDDAPQVNDRNAQWRAYQGQMAALEQMAAQGDPRAQMVLVEIAETPQDRMEILKKFFTPQEPQMSPEEEAMAQMGMGGGMEIGPPPSVQSILSQLEQGGGVKGGAQTVVSRRR